MKVSELTGAPLDYWVARAEGMARPRIDTYTGYPPELDDTLACRVGPDDGSTFRPSTDWAKGGPIIDSMIAAGFNIASNDRLVECSNMDDEGNVRSDAIERIIFESGETTLIAVCRAKVASVYGDEVPDDPAWTISHQN